ncbi:DUF397 domain-containing protein [Lentzea californiensis]|uniref:DUF397 domain-containing protein n=1 Tax=Lentzea californiensis TaxID=438851 RepID=UPI002165B8DF|nr:DUF397 domain-containing protein [Lentzea californiensis]MCR3752790.1 protein of unknown function (DUF397) [Lentzea californiensis]
MWRKSSYSANAMDCVEVGLGIGIRDSKAPATHLAVEPGSWSAFLLSVKAGKFARSGQTD